MWQKLSHIVSIMDTLLTQLLYMNTPATHLAVHRLYMDWTDQAQQVHQLYMD